jgi:hypothetical protein
MAGMDERTKTLLEQYKMFIDVYKQHFDLYLKGVVLYYAAMGAVCGLLYRQDSRVASTPFLAIMISILLPIASVIALVGCAKSRGWVLDLKSAMEKIETELGVVSFPFSGPLGIILTIKFSASVFLLFGVLNIVWLIVRHRAG